ncbi:unnamed protein product, partial [Iphiclides podalirius]
MRRRHTPPETEASLLEAAVHRPLSHLIVDSRRRSSENCNLHNAALSAVKTTALRLSVQLSRLHSTL